MASNKIRKPARDEKGPDTLEQWEKETDDHHRALLLFAMQRHRTGTRNHVGRSWLRLMPVFGVAKASMYRWYQAGRWVERVQGHGREAARYAARLYRDRYYGHHALHDLALLRDLISDRVITAPEIETDIAKEAAAAIVRSVHLSAADSAEAADAQAKLDTAVSAINNRRIARNTELRDLAQDAIAVIREKLSKGTVNVRIADIRELTKVLQDLEEEANRLTHPEIADMETNLEIVDSVRVRIAKETGGSLVDAHLADAREAVLILEQLQRMEAIREAG